MNLQNRFPFACVAIITAIVMSAAPARAWWWSSKNVQKESEQAISKMLDRSQQQIFSSIHPVGRSTGIVLDRLVLADASMKPTTSESSVAWCYFQFTMFWKGPVNQNGKTVVGTLVNTKTGEIVNTKVLETNGITNEQAAYDAGYVLGALLGSQGQ